jgi:hypothetical protein
VARAFRKFEKMIRACGPVTMIPQKTRVVFMVRVRYAGAYPRKNSLLCSFALARHVEDPRFIRIEHYAPHFIGHTMRIDSEDQLDAQVQRWLKEAYRVGTQEALKRSHVRNKKRHVGRG